MKGKQTQGLAKIVEQEYGKKFSKYNQESGWLQRPLRQGQLHYAALDAVSVWDILRRVRERGGEQAEQVTSITGWRGFDEGKSAKMALQGYFEGYFGGYGNRRFGGKIGFLYRR